MGSIPSPDSDVELTLMESRSLGSSCLIFALSRDSSRCVHAHSSRRCNPASCQCHFVHWLSHVRLCDPMDCSTPGFPDCHHLPEFAQTHVRRFGDAIQPSHPLLSPSPLAFSLSSIRVFSNELALRITWPKYWSFGFSFSPSSEYSELISFRIDWLDLSRVLSSTSV